MGTSLHIYDGEWVSLAAAEAGLVPIPSTRLRRIPRMSRKTFSHCRSKFPSRVDELGIIAKQWASEFEAHQVIALRVSNADGAGAQGSGRARKRSGGGKWSTGDFQQNLRRWRQGATNGDQSTAGADVEGGGKFEEVLAFLIAAAHKDRDGQSQASPFATFVFGPASDQRNP